MAGRTGRRKRKPGHMRTIADLSKDNLRVAGDAIETMIEFRAYLPTDGMLVILSGKFRDDIREELGVPPLTPAGLGPERKRLDDLEDADLDRLFEAVLVLNGRFTGHMDDPELPKCLADVLARVGHARTARISTAEAPWHRRGDLHERQRTADAFPIERASVTPRVPHQSTPRPEPGSIVITPLPVSGESGG